jgi:hypothetical protein
MPLVTEKTNAAKSFKHLTFQITSQGKVLQTLTLTINPEELTQDEPARANVIRTLGGAYAEERGQDLITISIKGTTGYRKRIGVDGKETDGFQEFKSLRNDIYRYFLEPDGKLKQLQNGSDYELRFYNWEDDEYYAVFPLKFGLQRSKSRPLLYAYDLEMVCLYRLEKPPRLDVQDVIKNLKRFGIVGGMTFTSLALATMNFRLLLAGQNLPDQALDFTELVNNMNYAKIDSYMPTLTGIADFLDDLRLKLMAYTNGSMSYVDMLVADLQTKKNEIRQVCTDISKMEKVPYPLMVTLRDAQRQVGLLTSFPQYFREENGGVAK